MDLFQGAPLPSVTTTEKRGTTAPAFYTNYLQDIANLGKAGAQQMGVAGFSPLQMQAMQMAPNAAFAGANTLGQGVQLTSASGTTPVTALINQYLNPYTSAVVDEMGRLSQRNVQESVMPSLGAGSALTGGYGSRRQQQITGQTLRDIQADLLGRQMGALQTGYTQAGALAQNDLNRMLQAGQQMGTLGTEQQNISLKGLESLFNLGSKQQELAQKQLDLPMSRAQAFSQLLKGYQVPMTEFLEKKGPQPGAYSASPLSQISGLLTTIAALKNSPSDTSTSTSPTSSSSGTSPLTNAVSSAVNSAVNSVLAPSSMSTGYAASSPLTAAPSSAKGTMSLSEFRKLPISKQDAVRSSGVEIIGLG